MMDDESLALLLGVLLLATIILWFLQILGVVASLLAVGWVCWELGRRVVMRCCRWLCGKAASARKWWWNKLWDDPLERAQREAIQEIENTVHYYVGMQKRAVQWADAEETRRRQSG